MGAKARDKERKKSLINSRRKAGKIKFDYSIESKIGDCINAIKNCERDLKNPIFRENHMIIRKLDCARNLLEELQEKRMCRYEAFCLYFKNLDEQKISYGISDLKLKAAELEFEIPEEYMDDYRQRKHAKKEKHE